MEEIVEGAKEALGQLYLVMFQNDRARRRRIKRIG